MSAACDGAVNVYSSFPGQRPGWSLTCGTSEATPEFAAIVALADQVAGHPLGLINPTLYALSARRAPGIVDVTSGNNTVSFYQGTPRTPHTVTGYPARAGLRPGHRGRHGQRSMFVYELAGSPRPLTWASRGAATSAEPPEQLREPRRVHSLLGRVQLGERPPARLVDAVADVHGGHLAERALGDRAPARRSNGRLADQPAHPCPPTARWSPGAPRRVPRGRRSSRSPRPARGGRPRRSPRPASTPPPGVAQCGPFGGGSSYRNSSTRPDGSIGITRPGQPHRVAQSRPPRHCPSPV